MISWPLAQHLLLITAGSPHSAFSIIVPAAWGDTTRPTTQLTHDAAAGRAKFLPGGAVLPPSSLPGRVARTPPQSPPRPFPPKTVTRVHFPAYSVEFPLGPSHANQKADSPTHLIAVPNTLVHVDRCWHFAKRRTLLALRRIEKIFIHQLLGDRMRLLEIRVFHISKNYRFLLMKFHFFFGPAINPPYLYSKP